MSEFVGFTDDFGIDDILSSYFGCKFYIDSFVRLHPEEDSVEHFTAIIEPFKDSLDGVTSNAIAIWNRSFGDKTFERPDMIIATFLDCMMESRDTQNVICMNGTNGLR